MSERTITALYSDKADAERARDDLKSAGISVDHVDIHDQGDGSSAHAGGGFMGRLRGFFGDHEDSHAYAEGLRRGHYLLTAKVDDADADQAVRTLEASNAVDFDQSQESWRQEGWTGPSAGGPIGAAAGMASPATIDADRRMAQSEQSAQIAPVAQNRDEQVVPIVEEQLRVGKREVERGGVRVRSYVVETPVQEQVSLRDEHVSIERRPVDHAATNVDALFQDREIQMTETAEEAVVAKNAVVREELVIHKDVGERVEEINDSVRRTEVEIEDTTSRTGQTGVSTSKSV